MYVCMYVCELPMCIDIYIYIWGWMGWANGWLTSYAVSSYSSRGDSQSNFLRILFTARCASFRS